MVALVGALFALIVALYPVEATELVVVLPEEGGHTGTVVVERDGRRVVLDQPYAASRIVGDGAPQAEKLEAHDVRAAFRPVRATLPARPKSFQLYFITGTDTLTESSRSELARMQKELLERAAPDIIVIGHTDTVGEEVANDELSLQRALRVRGDLITTGIPAERIRAAGRGQREPIVPTEDGVDEPRNRRVEINVR